jgi:hypothetical protein
MNPDPKHLTVEPAPDTITNKLERIFQMIHDTLVVQRDAGERLQGTIPGAVADFSPHDAPIVSLLGRLEAMAEEAYQNAVAIRDSL